MLALSRFLLLCCLFCSSQALLFGQTVTDYYQLLANYDDDIKLHPIQQTEDGWVVNSSVHPDAIIRINEAEQFLEITNKSSNATFNLQLKILTKENGEHLIALAKNHLDIFLHGELQLLQGRNGRWHDKLPYLMPALSYQDFAEDHAGIAEEVFQAELNHHLEFGYDLSTSGNYIIAKMQTQNLQERCKAGDESVELYCPALAQLAYEHIKLKWNASSGAFSVSRKY